LWDSGERQVPAPPQVTQRFNPSDQVYVMGLDLAGRHIAHTLAGCETIPPVRYIIHEHYLRKQWNEANRQLTVYRGDDMIVRNRVVAEDTSGLVESSGDIIENLIVTVPAGQVVQALESIQHRLNHRSTICLVNDGLGVAEALTEAYFHNEAKRPVFLLGHFSTVLGHTNQRFSVHEVSPGRLYLSLFSRAREPGARFEIKRHPPLERTARATHFIRLLTAMPGLNATGHPMTDFLKYKLPTLAFRSIVDPLATLLECTYDQLPGNMYARQLMDQIIGELSHVVARLPECRDSEMSRQTAVVSMLRKHVLRKLMLQRNADSKMRSNTSRGWNTDLDFLAGYFIRRGREVQADVPTLSSITLAVKAKQMVMLKQVEAEVPFEE
jgi:cytochrome b translational activator protein CBS2